MECTSSVNRFSIAACVVGGKALEEPIVDHRLAATEPFFARLEDQIYGAVEAPGAGQVTRRAEEHGGMTIVPATVHPPLESRHVRKRVFLVHWQRVHVCAQADRPAAVVELAANHPDDAGLADTRVMFDP